MGDPYYVPGTAVLVGRMRDVLREIDYAAPVPAAGNIATTRCRSIRMIHKDQAPSTLLSCVGAEAMRMGARRAA